MQACATAGRVGRRFCWVLLAGWCAWQTSLRAEVEQTFPVLQVGAHTYRNVTVTTKSKNYVFLLHSEGLTNLKVSDLSPELLEKLGYSQTTTQPPATNAPLAAAKTWAKQTLAKVDNPQIRSLQAQGVEAFHRGLTVAEQSLPPLTRQTMVVAGGVILLLYLFGCYCGKLICEKAGKEPGPLIWIPVLQNLPMLRAAGMSGWWFLALFVPVLNIFAALVWCVKIAEARNKNGWLALLLILPVTNIVAFLYLAFGSGEPPQKIQSRVPLMALETA